MAHTLCQACVLTPQSLQVTLSLRVSVRTDREEDGALLLQQALALTPTLSGLLVKTAPPLSVMSFCHLITSF